MKLAKYIMVLLVVMVMTQSYPVAAFKPIGHYKLTVDVADTLGFSKQAAQILALGTVNPDYDHWETAEAHGQTPNCPPANSKCRVGMPLLGASVAQRAFFDYLSKKARSLDALKLREPGQALYHLGYALHAIQDLAAHQGMTNAKHTYRSYKAEDDPDDIAKHGDRYILAAQWTHEFLYDVRAALGCDWERLRSYNGSFPGVEGLRLDELVLSRDDTKFTPGRYVIYRALAEAFEKLPVGLRSVTWGNRNNPRDTAAISAVSKAAREAFIEVLGGRGTLLDTGTYHLGDGEFEDTADLETVITNQLVGEKYVLSFESDAPTKVRVRLCKLYGVDYGGRIWIDKTLAGRFSPEHNQSSYQSDPVEISTGQHTITIVADSQPAMGEETQMDADDLVFEKVILQGLVKHSTLKALGPATISRQHP